MRILRYGGGILLLFLFISGSLWAIARTPRFQFFGELHDRGITQRKAVALTFDDGPGVHNTRKVLEILERHAVPATFFMIGQNIESNPEIARQVLAKGHQLANHSYSHERMLFQSADFHRAEIEKTDALIRQVGFREEIVFRPPYGKKLFALPWVLSRLGKRTVTWDVESEDTRTQDPEALARNVLSRVRSGSIVLFHDGSTPKPGTLQALETVLRTLQEEGFQFVTVNELLGSSSGLAKKSAGIPSP